MWFKKNKNALLVVSAVAVGVAVFLVIFTETAKKSGNVPAGVFAAMYIGFAVMFIIAAVSIFAAFKSRGEKEEVKEESISRSKFLLEVSHEIRTPLNGLIGLNYQMRKHVDNPVKMNKYLDRADKLTTYMMALTNDIRDVSQIRSEDIELSMKPMSVEIILDNVYSMNAITLQKRNIGIEIVKTITAPQIIGDITRIEQVLVNLVQVAAAQTHDGGRITVTVNQETVENEMIMTTFKVSDDGEGLTKDQIENLFNEFSGAVGEQGTKLGLSLSRELMALMGGDLYAESRRGYGTTFVATLPAIATSYASLLEYETEGTFEREKKLSVLLADDNDLNAEIVTEILEESGFFVTRAVNGADAVSKFEASGDGEFDVILMDIQMPVMNGFEATRKIRSLNKADAKKIKIFACTANTFREDMDEAVNCGMDDFIPKPVKVSELMGKLSNE